MRGLGFPQWPQRENPFFLVATRWWNTTVLWPRHPFGSTGVRQNIGPPGPQKKTKLNSWHLCQNIGPPLTRQDNFVFFGGGGQRSYILAHTREHKAGSEPFLMRFFHFSRAEKMKYGVNMEKPQWRFSPVSCILKASFFRFN